MPTRTVLQFMSPEMGGAHPLVQDTDLQLNIDLPVNLLDMWADIIR